MTAAVFGRGLVVSLTPSPQSPWQEPSDIARLARAAAVNGAVAVKVDGPTAVEAVRAGVPGLTVLAVSIDAAPDQAVHITPTVEDARRLVEAGADVIELEADAAARREAGQDMAELVSACCALGRPVKAGVNTVEDAVCAVTAGAVMVSSSTMGYPASAAARPLPDLDLVAQLVAGVGVPVVAERGYHSVEQVRAALEAGAYAVVVGSAIVDPGWLTRRFAEAASLAMRRPIAGS